jgi:hypothetical protein
MEIKTPIKLEEVYATENTLLCAILLTLADERRSNPETGRRFVEFRLVPLDKCQELLEQNKALIDRLLGNYRRLVGVTRGF